jgi:hypothetical protein
MLKYIPLLLVLLVVPVIAQDTNQGFTLGLAWNQNASPQLQGWGTYDRRISGKIFSYSGYDVMPLASEEGKVPGLKFNAFTGIALQVTKLDKLTLWIQGAGGVATTGEVTTGQGNFGGFGHIAFNENWGLILGGQGSYSPIQGTDAILRIGLRYGVK